VQRRPPRDFTVPRHSLIRGERFRSMLHRTFGTTLIEELPRSFMCGSAELRSGRLEIAAWRPAWCVLTGRSGDFVGDFEGAARLLGLGIASGADGTPDIDRHHRHLGREITPCPPALLLRRP
jgi:hypothetical protein